MICPKCDKEMESGFIQGTGRLIWSTEKRKISTYPRDNGEDALLSDKYVFHLGNAQSFRCESCGFILTPIPPK